MEVEVPEVPGLHKTLTLTDLERSRQIYNDLPSDSDQPVVEQEHLDGLAKIFVRHNAHDYFGAHLLHGHFSLAEGTVLVGDETLPRWTRPVETSSLNLNELHGYTFIQTGSGFHPYEYHTGKIPNLASVGSEFYSDLLRFLNKFNLSSVFALEVLDNPSSTVKMDDPSPKVMELVLGDVGTLMIDSSRAHNCREYRQTGWTFTIYNGQPSVCSDGKEYHGTGPTGHVIGQTSRDKIRTRSDALNFLKRQNLIS
ncbi:hypothetical protein F5883DRAFT_512213 [Diaporthe sp. PMI_573]|nr:hypothetical protein F5883DRAFT_512213 [Diaporthaceae sp. PMI_573]